MNANVAKCLLVSKVLVADGMMSDDERQFLAGMMTKLGLTEDERKRVINLEGWDEAEPIVHERFPHPPDDPPNPTDGDTATPEPPPPPNMAATSTG